MKTTMNLFTLSMMIIAMTFSAQFAGAQSVVMTNQEPTITHIVIMNTNHGPVTIGLYGQDVPKTVDNFEFAATGAKAVAINWSMYS